MNNPAPSRRGALHVVGGTTAVAHGAVAADTPAAPPVAVASDYSPGRYRATPVLHARGRHLLNRFTPGVTPELTQEVRAAGGAQRWFHAQLENAHDGSADGVADWWPDLHLDAPSLWRREVTEVRGGWEVMHDYSCRQMMRRILSPRPVLEVMTDFWETQLHVPVTGDPQFTWRAAYGEVIRRHALGRFDDLLVEATTHPAMLIHLDGATSTRTLPNENLARELLELHTVGAGAFTEDDVTATTRILTGHKVDMWRSWAPSYQPADHWTGPVQALGFSDPNTDPDGRELTERYLRWLAHHPRTAQRIARRLAVRFVRDTPPQRLVDHLAAVYLEHDTAIIPVLLALVESLEFRRSVGAKRRDPVEDVIATHRVLGTTISPPTSEDAAANTLIWQATAPVPDPFVPAAESVASANLHWSMAGGRWPSKGITYREPAAWLPEESLSFRDLVDHLSRTILQRPSTARLLHACCEVTGTDPSATITAAHPLVRWKWSRLLVTLLDDPAHSRR